MSINQDLEDIGITKRIGLIIFLKNASDQYKLRRYGDIVYFSKKMRYCVLYVDEDEAARAIKEINNLDFVKHVKKSEEENLDLSSSHLEGQITDLAKKAENKLLDLQKESEDL